MATVLINTEQIVSKPASRILDVDKLYASMQDIITKMHAERRKNPGKVPELGFFTATRLRSLINSSLKQTGIKVPDLLSFVLDKNKADELAEFASNAQLFIVRNVMDIGAMDAKRCPQCAGHCVPGQVSVLPGYCL